MNKRTKIVLLFLAILFIWLYRPAVVEAVSCNPTKNGTEFTVASDCSFADIIDGIDAGTEAVNTAKLTVSGATLTIGNTQDLAVGSFEAVAGGEIIIPEGGSISIGKPLWITDADSDGYPAEGSKVIADTKPVGKMRASTVLDTSVVDGDDSLRCADTDTYLDPLSAIGNSPCKKCTGGVPNNRADGEEPTGCNANQKCNASGTCISKCFADGSVCTVNGECCTGTCTTFYADGDADGYGAGTAVKKCGATASGYATNNTDCYDADPNTTNAALAYPGSSYCGTTNRGDGSFDYNCGGTATLCGTPYYVYTTCACANGGSCSSPNLCKGRYNIAAVGCGVSGNEMLYGSVTRLVYSYTKCIGAGPAICVPVCANSSCSGYYASTAGTQACQ